MTFWKSSSRKMKKSFNSHFGSSFNAKVYCHFQWSVWKSNLRKMKMSFNCHFGSGFRVKVCCRSNDIYESPVQGKWKGFSTVILALASEQKFTVSFNDLCESPIQEKWKGLPTVTSKLNCRSWRDVYAKCSCQLGRFCTELACPCQLSYVHWRGSEVKKWCKKNFIW